MRSSLVVSLGVGLVLCGAAPPAGKVLTEQAEALAKASRPAAQEALKQLEELTDAESFRNLGFEALDEVKSAELGRPLPVVAIHLDELKNYKPGDDPYPLMHMTHRVIYPVLVKGEVRSGVEVHAKEGKWEMTSLGLSAPVRRYSMARERHAAGDPTLSYFLVKVPALNHVYLGHETEKGLRLVHVHEQAGQKDKLEAQPAADVLAELGPSAREHDGKSR